MFCKCSFLQVHYLNKFYSPAFLFSLFLSLPPKIIIYVCSPRETLLCTGQGKFGRFAVHKKIESLIFKNNLKPGMFQGIKREGVRRWGRIGSNASSNSIRISLT